MAERRMGATGGMRATALASVLGWAAILLLSGVLSLMGQVARGRPLDVTAAFTDQAPILILWALVTPLVFTWTRRWPLRGPRARRHLVIHAGLGVALVLALNVAIRLPLLAGPGGGPAALLHSLALGLSVYLPGALLAYGALVALGHVAMGWLPDGGDGRAPERIAVRTPTRTHVLPVDEIVWVEADDNHVRIHTVDGSYRTRGSMASVEEELPADAFVRIHRSRLVRVERIRQVQPLGNGDQVVVMDDGSELRVARGRRAALSDALGTAV